MNSHIEFIDRYNAFIEATMLDEESFRADLGEYITDESVLVEPDSIPGLGHLKGFDGWAQWRRTAYDLATRTQTQFVASEPEYFENGDVVLRYYEVSFSPRGDFPDGFQTAIIERYEFEEGKISKLSEFYADTTAFVRYFA